MSRVIDKDDVIRELESMRAMLFTVKHPDSLKYVERINNLLYSLYENSINGVALYIELDKVRQGISDSLGFNGMELDELQSDVWNGYIEFVTKKMKNTRTGLSWISNIPYFPS